MSKWRVLTEIDEPVPEFDFNNYWHTLLSRIPGKILMIERVPEPEDEPES